MKSPKNASKAPDADLAAARITAPVSGAIVALDPDIPPTHQRLQLVAAPVPANAALRWQLDGKALGQTPAATLAQRRAVMLQESAVAFDFLAREVVELGRFPHRRNPTPQEDAIVAQAMQATHVGHLAQRNVNTLSGGEKARVQLARSLAQIWEPRPDGADRWLLLDEPTAALDLAHQHQMMRLMRQWAHTQSTGVVAVLHDVNLALRYADDVLVLGVGACHSGSACDVLTPGLIDTIWGVQCQPVRGEDGVAQYLFA